MIEYPFAKYEPRPWELNHTEPVRTVVSLPKSHGIVGSAHYHHLDDALNQGKTDLERTVLSYDIERRRHDLYIAEDYRLNPHMFENKAIRFLRGDIAERVARRVFKRFLREFGPRQGKGGSIFNQGFNLKNKENYVVASNEQYVLMTKRYPNMILLRKEQGRYRCIKELDGLFDYRYFGQHHLLVLESKLGTLTNEEGSSMIDSAQLFDNLFSPLRELYPQAHLSYVLFSTEKALFKKRLREIQSAPRELSVLLQKNNVHPLFFTFRESQDQFSEMAEHLINEYPRFKETTRTIVGHTVVSESQMMLCDAKGIPQKVFVKDAEGRWIESAHPNRTTSHR